MYEGHDDRVQLVFKYFREGFCVHVEAGDRAVGRAKSRVLPWLGNDHYYCVMHGIGKGPLFQRFSQQGLEPRG